ncbi:MAG: hypothetical protein CL739_06780 [Chloroflexi bacterium]|nr:hypothetical protein [Chloroflexota bacterium]
MLGMGSMEILVILLISFLVLGPQKMISGARMLGDLLAEAKRFAQQIPHIDVDTPNFGRHADGVDSDLGHSDSELDLGQKPEPPIAFGSHRRRNANSGSSELLEDDQPNTQQNDIDDESERSSWG